ncbi:glucose-6-phosphate 1-dehydrogenase 4, chloroplastic-like isoform X1 [Chenopodium quinoa]|uniref:glucose-6-phosphate 1-dehydrogenase 4, chloroplastic-like isoform X1 n=1 Tax=Chenopodium quinoa TaxID=63459 RepID=UPI000B789558|nr:glucose-6-phosphate 1-dehydrogenase 4, chloroplastic-like isoform X1 [Chenopodium quinoa]
MSLSTFSSSIHTQNLSRQPVIPRSSSLVSLLPRLELDIAGCNTSYLGTICRIRQGIKVTGDYQASPTANLVLCGHASNYCHKFRGLKLWILKNLNIKLCNRKYGQEIKHKTSRVLDRNFLADSSRIVSSYENQVRDETGDSLGETRNVSIPEGSSNRNSSPKVSLLCGSSYVMQTSSVGFSLKEAEALSLSIAVIGATGDPSRKKIFPALFALYYSDFLPENVRIFGYSREKLTDEDLRSIVASTLTCRVDHQQNCGSKIDSFLSKTYYIGGDYDNQEGILKLNARMEQVEGDHGANRIFYLSVPQEAVLNVASCIADKSQTKIGWNRIIIEKPFGLDAWSSNMLTNSLLLKFEEKQIYRMDHLLGRNLIENLTVLRFSNLIFEPLWSRKFIRNVQIILSEELILESQSRYSGDYGVIREMVHSHILQMVALLAMETPISLDGEDIRNEKVKVLRSIGKLEPKDVILGQYKAMSKDKIDVSVTSMTPSFFAAALYINNARWDGVPFLIRAGTGLVSHRMEIRIQFDHVPGNIYRGLMGHNIDLATNELILQDVPDEAILIRVNNKVPGLSLHLDASELNLLYKDKYSAEVPDSYEHLILDVIEGDNHLFMRSDELAAAWNILNPVLQEIGEKNISPEMYDIGGRGPEGAYYLWAKHGVRWVED